MLIILVDYKQSTKINKFPDGSTKNQLNFPYIFVDQHFCHTKNQQFSYINKKPEIGKGSKMTFFFKFEWFLPKLEAKNGRKLRKSL